MNGPSFRALATPAALLAAGLFSAACGGDGDGDAPTDPDPSAVADVEVSPSSATLTAVGDTQQFEATARDASGGEVSGVTFTWSSSDPDVATVDSDGTAVARASGSVTVEAEARGETGSADLSVDQEVAELSISPDSATFEFVGDTQRFEAGARDANGNPIENPDLSWASSDTSVATVDGSGLATARGGGTARISASVSALSDTSHLEAPEQAVPGPPDEPVSENVPDVPFARPDSADFSTHNGTLISRRTLLLTFADGVTVGEANDLLVGIEADVIGGWPGPGILYIRVPDRSLSEAFSLHDSLASDDRIRSVNLDLEMHTRRLPARDTNVATTWRWDRSSAGNWWAPATRAPQMWNLDGLVQRSGGSAGCVASYEPSGPDTDHPDLRFDPVTTDGNSDHFTMTSGLIGTRSQWTNQSGVEGMSPWIDRIAGVSGAFGSYAAFLRSLRRNLLRNPPCPFRVMNMSAGVEPTRNLQQVPGAQVRGAGLNLGAILFWRPSLIVVQAGAEDATAAATPAADSAGAACWLAVQSGRATSSNALCVAMTDSTGARHRFSRSGNNVGAPGVCVRSTESSAPTLFGSPNYDSNFGSCPARTTDGGGGRGALYGVGVGTSFAAPLVTGLIESLDRLAATAPGLGSTLTPSRIRTLITGGATTTGGGSPRIDAFAAALALDARATGRPVQRALVDVDDGTRDGHLRSRVYPEDPSPGSSHTDDGIRGDGRIDMADLRVLRDAWTQLHVHTDERELDGGDAHPWKDLNRDGCVGGTQNLGTSGSRDCGSSGAPVTPEDRYPRYDFNGNGYVHREADHVRSSAPDSALAPFKVDPDNACSSAAAGCLRDLHVLEQMWEGAGARENVNAGGTEDIACTEPPAEEWNPTALTADRDDNGSVDYMHSFDVHFRVPGGAVVPPEEDDEDLFHAETFPFDDGTPNGTFASYNLHGADRLFVKCRFDAAENAEVSVPVAETGPGFNYVIWQGANEVTDGHRAVEDESTYNWVKIGFEPKHGEDFGFGAVYDSDLGMESTSRGVSDDWFVVAREVIFRDRSDPGDNTDAYDVWDTSEGTISPCLRTEAKADEEHADTPFHLAMEEKANQVWVETSEASPVSLLKQWVGQEKVITALPIASHHDPATCSDTPDGFTRQKGKLWGVWLQVNSVE